MYALKRAYEMATYAIGDIQGCYDAFRRLLTKIKFNAQSDTLWLCGDLVNRGPHSLEVLRFVRDLPHTKIVLGNHDIHLLAVYEKVVPLNKLDTFTDVLEAADAAELCAWLRQHPFLHYDAALQYMLVHAGLAPQWDLLQAQQCADEVKAALSGPAYLQLLQQLYGNEPVCWSDALSGYDRLRFILNCFTRLRFCDVAGHLHLEYKGPLGSQPAHLMPWFDVPWRRSQAVSILFGHWSALEGSIHSPHVTALDTGCVWGGCLTAMCLETKQFYREECVGYATY